MKNEINFIQNWNDKLERDFFTTIRKYSDEKYNFYIGNLKKSFDVYLMGEYKRSVTLEHVGVSIRLNQLPSGLLMVDTGLKHPFPLFERFGIKEDSPVIVLTFSKEEEDWNQISMKL